MPAPPVFERYELRGTLGRGGFATVYRAFDRRLRREVALKVLHPYIAEDDEAAEKFLDEARRLAQLHHPNIVAVYDVDEADGISFFTMERIEGQPLTRLVIPGQGLAAPRVVELLDPLCRAVDYLHERRIVHRDIKAANIMLADDGRVVLMDFGISRLFDGSTSTRTSQVMGTPEAMAPEQVRGERVGPLADIYALGVLTYRLLAGQPPFTGSGEQVLLAHLHEPPPPLEETRPGLPASVYRAVEAALAKEPEERPVTAAAFLHLLTGSMPTGPELVLPSGGRHRRVHLAGLVAAAIALSFVVIVFARQLDHSASTRAADSARASPRTGGSARTGVGATPFASPDDVRTPAAAASTALVSDAGASPSASAGEAPTPVVGASTVVASPPAPTATAVATADETAGTDSGREFRARS